jgi:hypothetical protein
VPDRAESWLLQPSPFIFLFSLILALRQTSLVPKTNELSLETYLLVDLHFIHHMAYNNPLNMCWTLNHQNILEWLKGTFPFQRCAEEVWVRDQESPQQFLAGGLHRRATLHRG